MVLFSMFLLFFIIMVYGLSAIGAGMYFDDKNCYPFKFIYIIAVFTPIWNTYLTFKYITSDYGSVKEAVKYHFTWGK